VPDARGTVLDLPHVVPAVETVGKSHGLSGRLDAIGGDFFTTVPGGYDTYVLSMILHDWDDERAHRILANIAAASPGARVVALELVVPPGCGPHLAKMIDLTMLAMLTGRERTEPEMRSLFEGAGLRYERTSSGPGPISVLEAHVP
jgi:O-methyltransferase domain